MELVFAPYLKLDERVVVGPWTMLPTRLIEDVSSRATQDVAKRLAWAYNGDDERRGAFAFKTRGELGRPVRKRHVDMLHRALTLAVLDANDASGRRGRDYTTEHAAVWGHPLRDPTFTVVNYGGLIGGLNGIPLDGSAQVPPPPELEGGRGRSWDPELAGTAFAAMVSGSEFGARLHRSLYWLGHANENAGVPADVRIFSLRTAFEMLFDAGSFTEPLAHRVDDLLDPNGARPVRDYTDHRGRPKSEAFGDPGWWFVKFSHLRNAITHDISVPASAWRWGRDRHFNVGDRQFRSAVRHFLVQEAQGDDVLKLPHDQRATARRRKAMESIMRRHGF